jgi:hypothetical protein
MCRLCQWHQYCHCCHWCQRHCTVFRFVWVSASFGTCTVVSVNGTLVEAKMCTFTLESTHFIFSKCPNYTHDGASAKFSTNSHETDFSVAANNWNLVLRGTDSWKKPEVKNFVALSLKVSYYLTVWRNYTFWWLKAYLATYHISPLG